MAKGKFEGPSTKQTTRGQSGASRGREPAAQKYTQPRAKKPAGRKVWPILVAAAGALIVLGGALLLLNGSGLLNFHKEPATEPDPGLIADRVFAAGVDLSGMNEEQALAALEAAAPAYSQQMHLTVRQATEKGKEATAEPVELVFPASETGVSLNPQNAFQEAYRVGREIAAPGSGETYVVDALRCLSIDTTSIQNKVNEAAKSLGAGNKLQQTTVTPTHGRREVEVPQEDGSTATETRDVTVLQFVQGTAGVELRSDDLFDAVMDAYAHAQFDLSYEYKRTDPDAVDVDKLEKEYCVEPVDAKYDKVRHEVVDEVPGKGFDREELERLLKETPEGERFEIAVLDIQPEVTAEQMRNSLFSDALATVSTPLTAYWNRTHNIELACKAISGTVVLPGETFSFNGTVGIRTEDKGYLPATAYVSGGASQEEIGGGVCQVASSIYYATLLADLKTVERYAHMYAVTYVPMGMDAAIYWGAQDFKFENNTDYPLRIDAVCSGGYVNIQLVGTDDRDYRVVMDYEILETIPWEEKEVETNDVLPGTVITTAYTGYRVATYMHKISKATGEELSVEKVASSYYSKRDREVAIPIGGWYQETTEPTAPSDNWYWTDPTDPEPSGDAGAMIGGGEDSGEPGNSGDGGWDIGIGGDEGNPGGDGNIGDDSGIGLP